MYPSDLNCTTTGRWEKLPYTPVNNAMSLSHTPHLHAFRSMRGLRVNVGLVSVHYCLGTQCTVVYVPDLSAVDHTI